MNIYLAKRGPDRRRRAPSTVLLTLLLWVSLLPIKAAFAQDATNTGTVHVNQATTVHFGGNFTNNSSSTVTNDGNLEVTGALNFQNGKIDEPNNGIVIFLDGATATNAADASHVDGPVRKIGNDAFTFPTGDSGQYGPIGISAPAAVTDQIDAEYVLANPQTAMGATLGSGLTVLSNVEYWQLTGTVGVNVTLHWDSGSNVSGLSSGLTKLRVAGWDGGQWVDLGNNATTGDTTTGTITANGITPNSYQAYALGATSAAPVITSASIANAAENQIAVTTVTATDGDGDTLSYSITGGADAAKFSINSSTGVLTFVAAPDFEAPTDAGGDNVYDVQVTVIDGNGGTDVQDIAVTVTDVADTPDLVTTIGQPSPDLVAGMASNVPVTVTNSGNAPATGPLTTVVTLPTGVTAPASFTDNGWNCTTGGQTVTCVNAGALANGSDSSFNVPVTPDNSTIGTTPGPFTVTVDPVTDEVNAANNGPATMSPTTPVAAAATPPTVTSGGSVSIPENTIVVTDVTASGTAPITYSIVGGADAAKFTLDPNTGALSFVSAPDYENPTDSGGNNGYDVIVRASNSAGTDDQPLAVTINDVVEGALITVPTAVTGTEDSAIPLGITVDPSLTQGGVQQNIISTEVGFRAENAGGVATNFTIPPGATSVRISGYGAGAFGAADSLDENFQTSQIIVDLEQNTYGGQIFYVVGDGTANNDNYAFSDIALGASSTSNTWIGDNDNSRNTITITVTGPVLSLVESQSQMSQAYLVEYLTSSGSSANLLGSTGAFMGSNVLSETLALPANGDFLVLSILDGSGGANNNDEEPGMGRFLIDLDSGLTSGAIFAVTSNNDNGTASYAFSDYAINTGLSVLSSGATIIGDTTAAAGLLPDWTISVIGSQLTLTRTSTFASNFSSMVSVQSYERVALSSSAVTLGTSATSGSYNGSVATVTHTYSLTVPASAQSGSMSVALVTPNGGSSILAENSGVAQVFIDLGNQTTSGSSMMLRQTTPDLVSWANVPFGVRIFDDPNKVSNRGTIGAFNDEVLARLQFDLVSQGDGTRILQITSQTAKSGSFRNWELVFQAQWVGRLPISVGNVPVGATLSAGAFDALSGDWLLDPADVTGVALNPPLNYSGQSTVLLVGYDGSSNPLLVNITRVADAPQLVTADPLGDAGTTIIDLSQAFTATLVDQDGSETLSLVELNGIPDGHTVSDGVNSFTAGGGNGAVAITNWNWSSLTYQGPAAVNGDFTIGVRVQSTDDDGFSPTTDSAETTGSFTVTLWAPPLIIQPASDPVTITLPEGTVTITDINTIDEFDVEGGALTYGIYGPDAALFNLEDLYGYLDFTNAPDYENPQDSDGDNVYNITIIVVDSNGLEDTVDIAIVITNVNDTVDLAIDVGAPTPRLTAGVTSTIPVTVSNLGGIPATGPLTVTVSLPLSVTTPVSFSENGWSCTTSGQTVTCHNGGPLNAGASSSFHVPVTPDESLIGLIPGPLTATVEPTDPNPTNNGPALAIIVDPVARDAQITVVKRVDNLTPTVGDLITFTIQITNSGPSGAISVVISDVLQSGFSYVASSTGGDSNDDSDPSGVGLRWTINRLAVNATTAVSFQATVNPSGIYTNVADVTGPGVTVVDPPGPTGPSIIVNVTNSAPVITAPTGIPATVNVPENTTSVIDVETTDDGDMEGNGTLTYTLSGPDAAHFTIDPATGVVSFVAAPDYENPGDVDMNNVYSITVTVVDSGGLTDSVEIAVTVSDDPSDNGIMVPVRVFLGGAYDNSDTLMHDDLRSKGVLALYGLSEPYASAPYSATFSHVGGGGGESVAPSVLAVTGNDAIVDWVFLEVRDTTTHVVATRAALLQRDGDVVDVDGVSPVSAAVTAGNYYVVVRHRNHLGVMTANPVALSASTASIDFTTGVGTYGGDGLAAQQAFGANFALIEGNANGDDRLRYLSDAAVINNSVVAAAGNASGQLNYTGLTNVYRAADLNLDGAVRVAGGSGTRGSDLTLLRNILLQHPNNTLGTLNFLVIQAVIGGAG